MKLSEQLREKEAMGLYEDDYKAIKELEAERDKYKRLFEDLGSRNSHNVEQIISLKEKCTLYKRALDILGLVAEQKMDCGGYPAANWALHVAEKTMTILQRLGLCLLNRMGE